MKQSQTEMEMRMLRMQRAQQGIERNLSKRIEILEKNMLKVVRCLGIKGMEEQ